MGYCSGSFRFNQVRLVAGFSALHLILLDKIMAEPKSENSGLLILLPLTTTKKGHQNKKNTREIINLVGHCDNRHKLVLSQAN